MPLDPELVAEHLGLVLDDPWDDPRLMRATAAAEAWVERRRDVSALEEVRDAFWESPDFQQAGVLYAALIYQSRAQPDGFAGYSDLGNSDTGTGEAMSQIFRLCPAAVVTA